MLGKFGSYPRLAKVFKPFFDIAHGKAVNFVNGVVRVEPIFELWIFFEYVFDVAPVIPCAHFISPFPRGVCDIFLFKFLEH